MRIGLSDDFGIILNNLSRNQQSLENLSTQLSSGLRINSAADDPSGLAIAESLKSKSSGLQQGVTNVQTANNALTVAEGAMKTVTEILQRMRSLVVEANSDLNSQTDLNDIQSEISQLSLEINRISQNTNFNGLHLLDGSLSNKLPTPSSVTYESNPQSASGAGTIIDEPTSFAQTPSEQIEMQLSVDSYDSTSNTLQITLTVQSPDAGFGPTQVQVLHVTPGTNWFVEGGGPVPPPGNVVQDQNGNAVYTFNLNNLSASDVGSQVILFTTPELLGSNGSPLTVNDSGTEGGTVSISIDACNTATLGVSEIEVGNELANQAAEGRLDNALDTITTQRAQIGAQMVALGEDANDASNQVVQQTASESSIRDLNVGQATTEFTRQQILVQVGTNVLAQSEVDTTQLTALYINALVA